MRSFPTPTPLVEERPLGEVALALPQSEGHILIKKRAYLSVDPFFVLWVSPPFCFSTQKLFDHTTFFCDHVVAKFVVDDSSHGIPCIPFLS